MSAVKKSFAIAATALRQHRQRHRPAQPGLRQHLRQRLT
nr:hypothetical protein [Streptomyces xanthophaeus]